MIKNIVIILLISFLFGCIVKVGYVWKKTYEPYKEYEHTEKIEHTKTEMKYVYDFTLEAYSWKNVSVHDYYEYKKYMVKDYEDYLLVVKDKKSDNKTTYYVEDYIYNKLMIEHTYDQDIYRGSLDDFNNEWILIDTWRD